MMLPNFEIKMEKELKLDDVPPPKKERNFPQLELNNPSNLSTNTTQPILVIQSPKTPTLSRKLKAVSLDSDPPKENQTLEVTRDVFSMPNTPKRQIKPKYHIDFEDGPNKSTLTPSFSSNLKRFGSNTSISGSQTLKTLPEIMTLQDFSDNKTEPVRIKAKGLLERRGSNASLTIDLGSNSNLNDSKPTPMVRLNTAKSVSNLHLSTFDSEKCKCDNQQMDKKFNADRRKSSTHSETCKNCTIYESLPSKSNVCKSKCQNLYKRCNCLCNSNCRRKSLSNENLYVPPCNFCNNGGSKECLLGSKNCKGYRRACYPRQADLEASQLLSEDFKLHLQNVQYLQTAGSVLRVADLKLACEPHRVPKLNQEFWEVPLNLQEKCLVSGSQSRNRYRGVLPNEHSRVILPGQQPYIHANYIKGPDYSETTYIATQGPMSHTCVDFWEMVWCNKTNCIVMLTHLVEKGRNKCELYFPLGKGNATEKSYYRVKTTKVCDKFTFESRNAQLYEEEIISFEELNEVKFGNFIVSYLSEQTLGECTIRYLELSKIGEVNDKRLIHHYWFPNWQDHKMANPEQVLQIALHVLNFTTNNLKNNDNNISNKSLNHKTHNIIKKPSVISNSATQSFDSFIKKDDDNQTLNGFNTTDNKNLNAFLDKPISSVRRKSYENCKSPIIVHCSAGIGRTGCFLAILNGIQQLKSNYNVDVLAILCSLRLNRGGMVQTAEQYELIHRVLSLYTDIM